MLILVVDDSRAMRMVVQHKVRQCGHHDARFLEAENGEDALKIALANTAIDLILCDWNMPKMTGIEFLNKLREAECDVPFGFITSESAPEMLQAAAQAGAQFLLNKPFTVEALGAALESVVS